MQARSSFELRAKGRVVSGRFDRGGSGLTEMETGVESCPIFCQAPPGFRWCALRSILTIATVASSIYSNHLYTPFWKIEKNDQLSGSHGGFTGSRWWLMILILHLNSNFVG